MIMAQALDVSNLTNDDLASELRKHGFHGAVITSSTRPLYEKKLLSYYGITQNDSLSSPTASPTFVATSLVSNNQQERQCDMNVSSKGFYAVAIKLNDREQSTFSTDAFLFDTKEDALKCVKQYKGSRFKFFTSEELARDFIVQRDEAPGFQVSAAPSDSSAYSGPRIQELVKFRRMLECGDLINIRSTVLSNPRFLINSGDTPVILQEGPRYNALHVCAIKGQSAAAKFILETIENSTFYQMLYPLDSDESRNSRIKYVTDLYVNMPDKGFNETPLHFACKFGHVDVVKVLVANGKSDRSFRNNDGLSAAEVHLWPLYVTANINADKIYVALWRNKGNAAPARIGEPLKQDQLLKSLHSSVEVGSAGETDEHVHAYAGPMSPTQAKEFRRAWLTPPRSPLEAQKHLMMRCSDSEKGHERIGRELAEQKDTQWLEFWNFLESYTNVSSPEGMVKLNKYLEAKESQAITEAKTNSALSELELCMKKLNLDDTLTESNSLAAGSLLHPNDLAQMKSTRTISVLKGHHASLPHTFGDLMPTPSTKVTQEYEPPEQAQRVNSFSDMRLSRTLSTSSDSDDSYYTAATKTPVDSDDEDASQVYSKKLEAANINIYIEGPSPSKLDLDVLRALSKADVSPALYPSLYRWRKTVESHPVVERSNWPSPTRLRHNSTPRRRVRDSGGASPLLGNIWSRRPLTKNLMQSDEFS